MEVDICLPYAYFFIVTATTGLTTFYVLRSILPDDLPNDRITYLGTYPATWFTHTTYITTQKCLPQSR